MNNKISIPPHWEMCSIPEILFFQEGPGVRNSQYCHKGVKLINVGNLVDGNLDLSTTARYISEDEAYGRYSHFLVEERDLIIGSSGITIDTFHKKIAFAKSEHLPLCMNTSTIRFRPLNSQKLDIKYFKYFLATNFFKSQLAKFITGTAQLNFGPTHLKQMICPLPPLDEQRRIAAILDKADAIRRKRQESISLTEEFLRSVFLDMFGDPVTNPKGWDKAPIKEIGTVMTGNTPLRKKSEYYGNGIEWIKSDNINTPNHFLTEAKERLTSEGQTVGRLVPKNSILVTCIAGSPECIGNAAITDRTVAFNQQINAVTSFEGVDPYFLYVQILVAKNLIQRQSTESMKGMVSKGKFENILFLKPPYPLQEKFGKIFNKFHDAFRKNNEALSESNNLFGAITQRAFRGEL